MTLQYCSDLHLEFPRNKKFLESFPLQPDGEVLILAGDILPFGLHKKQTGFIDFVADSFEMVYWVPGNHEYYGHDAATVIDPLLEKMRSNVWLVNNRVIAYKDVQFICSTLWSKIPVVNALDIQRSISDFHAIRWQEKLLCAEQFNQLHEKSVAFLQRAFEEKDNKKTVVVTHHVPTLNQYPDQYVNSPLNGAFVTELYDLIYGCGASYWIYGYHHSNIGAFTIGETTLLTNQLGYVENGEHAGFNRNAVIEI
jgi:predicted MPP superfamily phosphohydrolase